MDKDLQEVIENSEDKKKKEEDVNKAFFVENISVNNIEAQGNSNAGSEERNQNEPWIKIIRLGYLLGEQAYPVWYPAQFYQILEEFMLQDQIAMDVWRAAPETSAAIETVTQAIFGGMLLSEDGRICEMDSPDMIAGVKWLRDAVDDGMIGYCETREDALERFASGQTAIFIDWTEGQMPDVGNADIVTVPYPAAVGLPVRSFELTGVCAFESGDARRNALAQKACVILHERAQEILGARGIWQDGACWPSSLDRDDRTATLRSLFCTAFGEVMEQGGRAEDALGRAAAAMRALE